MESGISFVKRNFLFKFVMFILILVGLSCFRTSALKVGDPISDKDCLTFTAIDGDATVKFSWANMVYRALISFSGVISMAAGEERELKDQYLIDDLLKAGYILPVREAGKVMCSIDDGDNWFNYDANKEIYLEKGESVKFKGSGISINTQGGFVTSGGNLSVSGKLSSLRLDGNLEKFIGLSNNCFYKMFNNCKNLIDASQLILDAQVLYIKCYQSMFFGCENLIYAPKLDNTNLATECYSHMFEKCKKLTKAPILPSTSLAEGCYSGMFAECESLVNAPELPATTLEKSCYSHMFYKCTSLTKVPDLPATHLAEDCYYGMFSECTNLEFSELVTDKYNKEWTIKTDDGKSGYKTMFDGCIVNWLKYAPENSTVTLYQKEKDNLMVSNGLTGNYDNDNKSETLSATSEEQEKTSIQESSDDIDPKYDTQLSDTKSVSSSKLANSQDYESKSSKSLADSKNSDSTSSNSLTNNQNSSGSSNAAKSSAIKTGELTLNSTLLEFFLLMLLSFKRKKFEF